MSNKSFLKKSFRILEAFLRLSMVMFMVVSALSLQVHTVSADGDLPIVTDIPNQTIAEGDSFTTINLDDYVSDLDTNDDQIIWTFSGETDLIVTIIDRVATIGFPNVDWNGSETITFIATDPQSNSDEDAATFTVTAVNDAPIVTDIPDQTIAEGASFTIITLDDYVSDVDNTDMEMTWTFSGDTDLNVDIDVNRIATISVPDLDWNGAETITFTATDPGLLFSENAATFTVTAVNDAPIVTDIPDQTIAEGASFTTIALDNYVSDVDNLDTQMTWTYSGETDLNVDIDVNRIVTISVPDPDWNGAETITFTATDPGLLFSENAATFTVTAVNDAPVCLGVPLSTAEDTAGEVAPSCTDVDGDPLTYEIVDQPTNGTASIVLGMLHYVPDADYNGGDTFTYRALDDTANSNAATVTVTVSEVNDAPVITGQVIVSTPMNNPLTITFTDLTIADVDNTYPTGFSLTVTALMRMAGASRWTG